MMLWFGPTPANEGIRRCELMRVEVRESPESEAAILRHLGGLLPVPFVECLALFLRG